MYADTNVTIPGAKFPSIGLKIDIKLQKKPDLHIILGRSIVGLRVVLVGVLGSLLPLFSKWPNKLNKVIS